MQDSVLMEKIERLFISSEFQSAKQLIYGRLSAGIDVSESHGIILKSNLAGWLIDIGSKSQDEHAIDDGLNIIEQERAILCQLITESSLEYNIANGLYAKFRIHASQPNFRFKPETIDLLTEAKNHYWKSYKLLPEKTLHHHPQLIINLANSLSHSGRIAEALPYHDFVLHYFPDFPNAHASRAEALLQLYQLSGSCSANLFFQARYGFKKALLSPEIPELMKQQLKERYDFVQEILENGGYSEENEEHDQQETQKEIDAHSDFRRFCLTRNLCLSEHALYCACAGARNDNLCIATEKAHVLEKRYFPMELLLNRLKAEFSFARFLFYQESHGDHAHVEGFDKEVNYMELFDGEVIGMRSEMLRTSFRMCFGILDKIARGLCELFGLAKATETIYFDSFWKNPHNLDRWNKINTLDNIPLSALYSQPTDLNMRNGEWGMFKSWRNLLEHNLLCLMADDNTNQDIYRIFANSSLFDRIPYSEFKFKTLHLLQFTRSAIFNFVFCVRMAVMKRDTKPVIYINLGFKE
jgi:tetratricopeptide (TPR) repeat protein